MKFCPKCGNPLNNENLKFCPQCGNSLINQEDTTDDKISNQTPVKKSGEKNKVLKIVIIMLVFVAICGGGYFAYNKYQENEKEKEQITDELALAEQKEKEEQEKNEVKNSLASKANVKDTLIFGMDEGKYLQYGGILGWM